MRCYRHPETAAVGMCKACHKGLCQNCAADTESGLACKDEHEETVLGYERLVNTQARAMFALPWFNYLFPLLFVFFGVVIMFGAFQSGKGLMSASFLYGIGCFLFGVIVFIRARKILGLKK